MDLDDATRRDFAAFLARRHPGADTLARVAREAGVEAPSEAGIAGWEALLVRAEGSGRLPALVDAAGRGLEGDANFDAVRALVAPPAPGPRIGLAIGAAVVAAVTVVGVVGGAVLWRASPTEDAGSPAAASPAVAAASPAVAPVAPPAPPAPPAVAPPTPPEPAPAPATPAPVASSARPSPGCAAPDGARVGWWYAGKEDPGPAGTTWTLRAAANVRSDYPNADNGFSMRGRVQCVLPAGTAQRLSHAPVNIGNGHWWVPVYGGDLPRGVLLHSPRRPDEP